MKNNMFAGFSTVFTYNFKNHVSSKKYIGVTIACALVLIIGIIVFMAAILKPKEEVIETIDKVYVTNETELGIPSYSAFAKMAEDDVTAAIELEKLDVTQPTLSHHMKVLDDCGLVHSRKDGKWSYYSINCEKFAAFKDYISVIACCDSVKRSCCCKN